MTLPTHDPESLSGHDRLREEVSSLVDKVWVEGRRDEDGLNKYVDQILQLCGDEAQKVLPPECGEVIRNLFEREDPNSLRSKEEK